MFSRIALAVLILCTSAVLQSARSHLVGIENKVLEAWPSQIIFGFYFAVLTISVGGLQKIASRKASESGDAVLLLLVLMALCLDLVLNNVFETVSHPGASYGIMILWDVTTFFVWLRTVELCVGKDGRKFNASWLVMVAPIFKLGREVLSLPYALPAGRAYLDLLFGDLFVCLWLFIPRGRIDGGEQGAPVKGAVRTFVRLAVIAGCIYWLLTAVENILFLAWPPLEIHLYTVLAHLNMPVIVLNFAYFISGVVLSLLIWRLNIFNIGTRLGFAEKPPCPK